MKFVVIFIQAVFFLVAFQNCAKKPVSSEVTVGQTPLKLFSSQTEISILDPMTHVTAYQISLGLDRVYNSTKSASCSVALNQNYLLAKKLFLENGICNYTYELPPNSMRCMAYSVPYASVSDGGSSAVEIGIEECMSNHNSLCGTLEQKHAFENAMGQLRTQLANDTACF